MIEDYIDGMHTETHGVTSFCSNCGMLWKRIDKHVCRIAGPAPKCACGCGQVVKHLHPHSGIWSQWKPGHHTRGRSRS